MVVVEVAGPGLEGEQVAVLRLQAASAGHATKAAYSCLRVVYVPQGTKYEGAPRKRPNFLERRYGEVPREPLPRTARACPEAPMVQEAPQPTRGGILGAPSQATR